MKIYKDIVSQDELLSDTFPIEVVDDCILKVKGKLRTDTTEIDESALGANASAEGTDAGDGTESSSVSGIDVVMNHNLQSSGMSKKAYKDYIKKYMKMVKERVTETNPDGVANWEKKVGKFVKGVLDKFDDYEMYVGESYNADGMVCLVNWEGETPYVYYFKDGLDEEKV